MEYEAVPRLSGEGMRAGAKIALTDPYVGEDGTIWLERATTELLGGCRGAVRAREDASDGGV